MKSQASQIKPHLSLFSFLFLLSLALVSCAGGPGKSGNPASIAFWNVENLFDLQDDPHKNDNEFLPDGSYNWTAEHYEIKLRNLSRVIDTLGDGDGPEILGLSEIENKKVIEDLIKTDLLKDQGYEIVHHDSPDQRGIDCALIYKPSYFKVLSYRGFEIPFPENSDIKTRDILMVKGLLSKKDTLIVMVNHWSSRYGGASESEWKRVRAAETARQVVDSIRKSNPDSKILLIGDFNDEPFDKSIKESLNAVMEIEDENQLFNPMAIIKQETGAGTLKYREWWNLFDQIIMTESMINGSGQKYVKGSASIYNPEWMQVESGSYKDAPKRSHISREFYPDGFSDHFPVYIHLQK